MEIAIIHTYLINIYFIGSIYKARCVVIHISDVNLEDFENYLEKKNMSDCVITFFGKK